MTSPRYISALSAARIVSEHRAEMDDLPLEATQGYPVPQWAEGKLFLAFPLFLGRGQPRADREVFEPEWVVRVDLESGTVAGVDQHHVGEHRRAGVLPYNPSRRIAEVEADRLALLEVLDEIIESSLAEAGPFHPDGELARRYAELWTRLRQEPLELFYRALNPDWFDALGC